MRVHVIGTSFSLPWHAPSHTGNVTLRVLLQKAGRLVVASRAARVTLGPPPLVVAPSTVVSFPPPGQPGRVVLHARAPGSSARRSIAACPALSSPPRVGQILAIGYSPSTPEGSLTKIDFVNAKPPCTIVITTVPATLAEALGSNGGDLDLARFKQVSHASSSRAARPAARTGATFNPGLSRGVSCTAGASAALKGSASIGVTPSLHAHFSIFGGLTSAEFLLTGTASASLSAELHASAGCDLKSTPVLAHPLRIATFVGTIGLIPVVVTLQGQLYVDATIDASADATSSLEASASIAGGVRYSKGRFSPVFSGPNTSFGFTPPMVSSDAGAAAHLEPALQALLYGVAGPQLSLTTGLDFKADTTSNPWWTLRSPLEIQGSLTAPTLDLKSGKLTLYGHIFRIADAGGPFSGPVPLAPRVVSGSFKATPSTLGPGGGQITLTANVENATTCELSATPATAGLPISTNCASGAASFLVSLPANGSESPRTYTFTLNVIGAPGTTPATATAMATVQGTASGGEHAFTVEKLQRIAETEAGYTTETLTGAIEQTVEYEIVVRNTGLAALRLSNFTDAMCDPGTIAGGRGEVPLASGEATTYACNHVLTCPGAYVNVATVTGTAPGEAPRTLPSNPVVVEVPGGPRPSCPEATGSSLQTFPRGVAEVRTIPRSSRRGATTSGAHLPAFAPNSRWWAEAQAR